MDTQVCKSYCPSCGEPIELVVDPTADEEYIEDCQVCCRPMIVSLLLGTDGDVAVAVRGEDEY